MPSNQMLNPASAAGPASSSSSSTGGPFTPNSPEELENSRRIARVHFEEFRLYLDAEGAKGACRLILSGLSSRPIAPITGRPKTIAHRARSRAGLSQADQTGLFPDPNARANAREKLTRLTRQQFQELSTDVYDELVRRKTTSMNSKSRLLPSLSGS